MSTDTLHKSIFLNASPDTVWDFLVDYAFWQAARRCAVCRLDFSCQH